MMRPFVRYRPQVIPLWEQTANLLHQMEHSPKGVCHLDCHPKNLFPMQNASSERYTVAIDWASVGIDHLGIDIGHMLGSSMLWMEVSSSEVRTLRDPVFDAYLTGLVESGWSGNEVQVRLSFLTRLTCAAIRQICLISHAIDNASFRAMEEKLLGKSLSEMSECYAEYFSFCVECQEEAQQLVAQL